MSDQHHTETNGAAQVAPLPRREWISLIIGILIILAANVGPLHRLAEKSFSAHMAQHMVLIVIGAPLLAIAWPFIAELLQDLFASIFGEKRANSIMAGINWCMRPAPALIISSVSLLVWHYPTFYDAAVENELLHAIEHLFFIATFIPFWRPLIYDRLDTKPIRSNGWLVLYLSIGMVVHGVLGAYLTFTRFVVYPHYERVPPPTGTALSDQHLGGAIMWSVASLAMVIAAMLAMREEEA